MSSSSLYVGQPKQRHSWWGCTWCMHMPHAASHVRSKMCVWFLPEQGKTVRGRVLVIADGATSKLATQMGYCTEAPKGVCSRAFIEGGTHNVDFDGAFLQHAAHALAPTSHPCPIVCCQRKAAADSLPGQERCMVAHVTSMLCCGGPAPEVAGASSCSRCVLSACPRVTAPVVP